MPLACLGDIKNERARLSIDATTTSAGLESADLATFVTWNYIAQPSRTGLAPVIAIDTLRNLYELRTYDIQITQRTHRSV